MKYFNTQFYLSNFCKKFEIQTAKCSPFYRLETKERVEGGGGVGVHQLHIKTKKTQLCINCFNHRNQIQTYVLKIEAAVV